jgi:predicted nuclease with RNAse H fold
MRDYHEPVDLTCDKCGHLFAMGDKMLIMHLWVTRRNLCEKCAEAVITFIDTPANETSN